MVPGAISEGESRINDGTLDRNGQCGTRYNCMFPLTPPGVAQYRGRRLDKAASDRCTCTWCSWCVVLRFRAVRCRGPPDQYHAPQEKNRIDFRGFVIIPHDHGGRFGEKEDVIMCYRVLAVAVVMLFGFALNLSAEITFRCDAGQGYECAFSVVDASNGGITNFVLGPGQNHGLNDNFRGGSYCVVVDRPRAQVRDFPPNCVNAVHPQIPTKGVVRNIQPGRIYN